MKTSKKLISIILSLVLIFSTVITTTYAVDELYSSFNIQNYSTERYGAIVSSQLHYDGNKLIRSEIDGNTVHIEEFDNNYNLSARYNVNGELENICGVYFGNTHNFIVCSQTNPNESDSVEVVRIIKYSKTWQRISSASIFGANTYIFADAGSLRFTEYGNYLYVRSCHEMYTSADGLHHQANMTFVVNTSTMTVTHNNCQVSNSDNGYVSHSFNQFIAVDEDTNSIIAVDHGDAYPRSIIMFRYDNQLGASSLTNPQNIELFQIAGEFGDNVTGVSVSDLIVTDNNYIVAFNSTPQDNVAVTRNVYIAVVPKNSFNNNSVNVIKITDYSGYDNIVCGYPYLTDMGNGKYSLIWEANTTDSTYSSTYYTTIDENGNILSSVNSFEAYLSDCEPVFINNKVIWYSTFNSEPVFYYVSNTSAGVDCDKYESVDDKIIPARWEYNEYFSTDSVLNININNNSSLVSFDVTSDTGMVGYSMYGNNFSIATYNYPGIYYLYAAFADGKVVKKSVIVKDAAEINNQSPVDCTHSYRALIIQEVTCTENGITEYICNYCNHSYTEYADATGHIDSDDDNHCDNCYATINATAHITADKSSYNINLDECAVLTIDCEYGTWVESIETTASCFAYSITNHTIYYYFSQCGVVTLTITLTDGQVLCYDIIITEDGQSPEPSTNPEPTTPEPTTPEPTTPAQTTAPATNPEQSTAPVQTTNPAPSTNPEPSTQGNNIPVLKGDFDNNGIISPSDARSVLRIAAMLDIAPDNIISLADMDGNGIITASDARKILRISAGLD